MRALAFVLLAAHLALVAWMMLRPLSVTWVYGTNVRPLATIERLLVADPAGAARSMAGGLLLLAPLGVLLPTVTGKIAVSVVGSFVRTVFLGALVSFAIECLQTGVPGQVFDVDSLILNTAGVALAHLAVVPVTRARLRRSGRLSPPRPPQPRVPRTPLASSGSASYGIAAHRGG